MSTTSFETSLGSALVKSLPRGCIKCHSQNLTINDCGTMQAVTCNKCDWSSQVPTSWGWQNEKPEPRGWESRDLGHLD